MDNERLVRACTITSRPDETFERFFANIIYDYSDFYKYNADAITRRTEVNGVLDKVFPNDSKFKESLIKFAEIYIIRTIAMVSDYGFDKAANEAAAQQAIVESLQKGINEKTSLLFIAWHLNKSCPDLISSDTNERNSFVNYVTSEPFINGLFIEIMTENKLKAQMVLTVARIMGESYYKSVCSKWEKHPLYNKLLADFKVSLWIDNIKSIFINGSQLESIKNKVKTECCASHRYTEDYLAGDNWIKLSTERNGTNVSNWLREHQHPGVTTGIIPDNSHKVSSGGCIAAGTKIMLASGETKNVQDVVRGDVIVSVGGNLSVASSELIVNPNVTEFYAINEDEPFLSPEHPILTQTGWKCLDPETARAINSHIEVSELTIGDVVCKVSGINGSPVYENILVHAINKAVKTNVVSYDLHFEEGYNSYHANNYCCMLNYPQLTANTMAAQIPSVLESATESAFLDIKDSLETARPFLNEMFNEYYIEYFERILNQGPVSQMIDPLFESDFGSRTFLYNQIIFDDDEQAFDELHIMNQNVAFITNDSIDFSDRAYVNKSDGVLFFEKDDRQYCLKILLDGMMAKGAVMENGTWRTFTALGDFFYKLSAKYTDGSAFDYGYLKMWYENFNGSYIARVSFLLDKNEDPDAAQYATCKLSYEMVNNVNKLVVYMNTNETCLQYVDHLFETAKLFISTDYSIVTGSGRYPGSNTNYDFNGHYEDATMPGLAFSNVANRIDMLKSALQDHLLNKSPIANQFYTRTLQRFTSEKALLQSIPLTVEGLYTVAPPGAMKQVQEYTNTKLFNMTLYATNETHSDWLKMFNLPCPLVGENQCLTREDVDYINNNAKVKKFLVETFAKAYFSDSLLALSEHDQYLKACFDKIDDAKNKLQYFWQGTDNDKCLSKNLVYKELSERLQSQAYYSLLPEFRCYVDSDKTGWAKKLYEYASYKNNLVNLVSVNTMADENSDVGFPKLHHIAAMLDIMDHSDQVTLSSSEITSYAAALNIKALNMSICSSFSNLKRLPSNVTSERLTELMRTVFLAYSNSLINSSHNFFGKIWNDEELKMYATPLKNYMQDNGIETINDLTPQLETYASELSEKVMQTKEWSLKDLAKYMDEMNYPALNSIFKAATGVIYLGSLGGSMISVLVKKGALTAAEWVSFTVGIIKDSINVFCSVTTFIALRAALNLKSLLPETLKAISTLENVFKEVDVIVASAKNAGGVNKFIMSIGKGIGEECAQEAGKMISFISRCSKILKIAKIALKAFAVLTLIACIAVSILEIVKGFGSGEYAVVLAFEIMEVVTTALCLVCESISLIAAMASVTVCSAIPVIGVVFAIIGAIIMIVLMFLPRKRQATESELFVDNISKKFIDGLVSPTAEWINNHGKKTETLKVALSNRPSVLSVT